MKIRATLNGLLPRTLRDAARDPYDWLQVSPRPDTPAEKMAGFVLVLIVSIIGAASLVHWWSS
jgi:hypothetical protein